MFFIAVLYMSDIKCSKNALTVKAKVQKMKLFINQSNSIIIKAVSGKHKIGLGILNQSETKNDWPLIIKTCYWYLI